MGWLTETSTGKWIETVFASIFGIFSMFRLYRKIIKNKRKKIWGTNEEKSFSNYVQSITQYMPLPKTEIRLTDKPKFG